MKQVTLNFCLSLFVVGALFTSTPAFSQSGASGQACGERLRTAIAGEKKVVNITRQSYRLAAGALRHYRSELNPEFEVYIDSLAEYRMPDGKIVGFKISITDGGDESMVDYILDHRRKLVSAYWHNQSPVRFWFCQ